MEQLIIKYLENRCSDEEREQIDSWIEASKQNLEEFEEIRTIWFSSQVIDIDPEAKWKEFEYKLASESRPIFNVFRIAASVLLLATIGSLFLYYNPSSSNQSKAMTSVLESSKDQKREVILPDGSVVTLNENSSIEYDIEFQRSRNLMLTGEAFFDIKRDENHPFVITTETMQVKVLGTSFNVNAKYPSNASVQVESGTVEVTTLSTNEVIRLIKDEQVVVSGSKLVKTRMVNSNAFCWKTEVIEFNNQDLRSALGELSSIYDVEIEVDDKLSNCLLTARFNKRPLNEVISLLQNTYGLEVKLVNKKMIIDGKPC